MCLHSFSLESNSPFRHNVRIASIWTVLNRNDVKSVFLLATGYELVISASRGLMSVYNPNPKGM